MDTCPLAPPHDNKISLNCLPDWMHSYSGCICPLCIFRCVLKLGFSSTCLQTKLLNTFMSWLTKAASLYRLSYFGIIIVLECGEDFSMGSDYLKCGWRWQFSFDSDVFHFHFSFNPQTMVNLSLKEPAPRRQQ